MDFRNHSTPDKGSVFVVVLYAAMLLFCTYIIAEDVVNYQSMKKNGQRVVATIIYKYKCFVIFDIEYQGVYYQGRKCLNFSDGRRCRVGERCEGLINPYQFKHYHQNSYDESFIKLIYKPLSEEEQDIEGEVYRINQQYTFCLYKNN